MDINAILDEMASPGYKSWLQSHPNGTLDEYHAFLAQQNLEHRQTPEYQIKSLKNEIENLNSDIHTLQSRIGELNLEIEDKDNTISNLQTYNQFLSISVGILILVSIVFAIKIWRRRA